MDRQCWSGEAGLDPLALPKPRTRNAEGMWQRDQGKRDPHKP